MSSVNRVTTARQVLVQALRAVQSGWCQGAGSRLHPKHGNEQVCASYAITNVPARRPYVTRQAMSVLNQAIGNGYTDSRHNIFKWNDDTRRVKSQVVKTFRKAITLA